MKTKQTLIIGTDPPGLQRAADILRRGGLVVFPTETVYGLGANALDEEACRGIFEAKGRPQDNPLIVHLPDPFAVPRAASEIPPQAAALIAAFMPGPLTIVLPKNPDIPDSVTAGLSTVGIRVPRDTVAQSFLRLAGVPVAAPSANLSGKPSPTTFEMARDAMEGRVDAIIHGEDCPVGIESTVVRVLGKIVEVLRPGKVSEEDIRRILSDVVLAGVSGEQDRPAAPGMKYTHYKPRAEVFLFSDREEAFVTAETGGGGKIGILLMDPGAAVETPEEGLRGKDPRLLIRNLRNVEEYGRRLYAEFFVLDRLGCELILAEYPPPEGIGAAVRNRLMKAAGGRFVSSFQDLRR